MEILRWLGFEVWVEIVRLLTFQMGGDLEVGGDLGWLGT